MGLFFLFGFILWGWAEMSAFIYIGGEIGGLYTLLGIFITAIIGLSLLKSQGGAVITKIRTDLAQGRAPIGSFADSISLVIGGILMLVPGYVTDIIGILLLSFIGDTLVSLLKRDACVKDSGHILPGHGGLLDRFDSFIAVFFI